MQPCTPLPERWEHRTARVGSFVWCCTAKNCTSEVSKLWGWQLDMIEWRNKKPCPYDVLVFWGFTLGFFSPPKWIYLTKNKDRIIYGEEGSRKKSIYFSHIFINHNKPPSLTIFIPTAGWALCCSAEIQSLGFPPWLFASWRGQETQSCWAAPLETCKVRLKGALSNLI